MSQQRESASWIRSLNASDRHNGCFFLLVIPKRSFGAVVIIACLIKRILASLVPRPRFPTAAGGLHHRYVESGSGK